MEKKQLISIVHALGYSEYQTGLTFDLGGKNSDKNLYASFDKTKEGQWIANNAYKYGFIVRYP
jgi:D-alanyl-D-alanine carboxypeptidase